MVVPTVFLEVPEVLEVDCIATELLRIPVYQHTTECDRNNHRMIDQKPTF